MLVSKWLCTGSSMYILAVGGVCDTQRMDPCIWFCFYSESPSWQISGIFVSSWFQHRRPFMCCYIFTFSSIKTKDHQRQGLKMSQIFYWVIKQTGFKHLFLLFRSGCASSWKSGKTNQIIHTYSQKWLTLIVIILQEKWNREFFLWDKSTLSCFGQSGASSGTPFINNTFSRYFTI